MSVQAKLKAKGLNHVNHVMQEEAVSASQIPLCP